MANVIHIRDIVSVQTLGMPDDATAQHLIRRVLEIVRPVMRAHSYRVGTLEEFFPDDRNLLGMNHNHGERIQLRLRRNKKTFFPFESVVGTMLHELCHNEIGPHNKAFFTLLDALTKECEEHWIQSVATAPFRGIPRILGCGGGGIEHCRRGTAQVMAGRAAEKRERDACGGPLAVTMLSCPQCTLENPPNAVRCEACEGPLFYREYNAAPSVVPQRVHPSPGPLTSSNESQIEGRRPMLSCPQCTLENPPNAVRCEACEGPLVIREHNSVVPQRVHPPPGPLTSSGESQIEGRRERGFSVGDPIVL